MAQAIGKVSLTPRGAYNAGTAYAEKDLVSYQGSGYIVLKACTGVTPAAGEYYMLYAEKGDTGEKGDSGVYVGAEEPEDGDVKVWINPDGGAAMSPKIIMHNMLWGNIPFVTFSTFYHAWSPVHRTTCAVYALQTATSNQTVQSVYKSADYGRTWVKMGDIPAVYANGVRVEQIFVEPRQETIYALKCTDFNAANPTYVVESYDAQLSLLGSLDIGTRTWHSAMHNADCGVLKNTYTNAVMFAEYAGTSSGAVGTVRVWKTTDRGATWTNTFEQTSNNGAGPGEYQVRHFHALQYDPFTGDWWLASGDADAHSKIWRSQDDGATWTVLFGGSQGERTISFVFEQGYVYYGMDNPDAAVPTLIYRIDKTALTKEPAAVCCNNLAVYGLTKTFYPNGFLVWPVYEHGVSAPGDIMKIQFYDYKTNELTDAAELDVRAFAGGSIGFPEASRFQSIQDGSLFAVPVPVGLRSVYGGASDARSAVVRMQLTM